MREKGNKRSRELFAHEFLLNFLSFPLKVNFEILEN